MKVKDLKRELENIDDNDDVKFSIVEWDRIQCKHVELTVLIVDQVKSDYYGEFQLQTEYENVPKLMNFR